MRAGFVCLGFFLLSVAIASETDPRPNSSEKLKHWRREKRNTQEDENDGGNADLSARVRQQHGLDHPIGARQMDSAVGQKVDMFSTEPRCEDRRDAVPEFAFNPLDSMRAIHTHPAFRRFRVESSVFDPRFIFEAFGVRVDYHYDCTVTKRAQFGNIDAVAFDAEGYRKFVPARSLACQQHEARLRLQRGAKPSCVQGFFPPVDDEYIEYADALQSVAEHDVSLPYVVVEVGARYGTWAVRCVKALLQLHPAANYQAYLVESEELSAQRCREHCANNGVTCTVIDSLVGAGPEMLSLSTLLDSIESEQIDYLDLDIQGFELDALREADLMPSLVRRVRRLHIGTHSRRIHDLLKDHFIHEGWVLTIDYPGALDMDHPSGVEGCDGDRYVSWDALQGDPACWQMTGFGAVYVRDGILAFANPTLLANGGGAGKTDTGGGGFKL